MGRIRIMRPPLFTDRVRHVASTGSHMVIALDECNSPAPQETEKNKKHSSFLDEFLVNVPKRLDALLSAYWVLYTNPKNWDWDFSASDVDSQESNTKDKQSSEVPNDHDIVVIPWTNVASFDTTDGKYATCDSTKRWMDHEPAIDQGETPLGQAIEYSVLFESGSALLSDVRKEVVKAVRDGAEKCATETESLTVDIRGYASATQFQGVSDKEENKKLNCALSGARVAEVLTTVAKTETAELRELGKKLKQLHDAYKAYMEDQVSEKRKNWHNILLREFDGYCSNPPEPRSIKVANLTFRWVATDEKTPWWLTRGDADQELTLNRSVHLIPVEKNGRFGACEFVQGVGQ